jgi:hypothetical protein
MRVTVVYAGLPQEDDPDMDDAMHCTIAFDRALDADVG